MPKVPVTTSMFIAAAIALAGGAGVPSEARAAVVISIVETGPDVVATTSGTLDLTGLTYLGVGSTGGGQIRGNSPLFASTAGSLDFYRGISGIVSFGSGVFGLASSSTGDQFYFANTFFGARIAVPVGYVSNAELAASTIFSSSTLASLGLTQGTYTFSTPADSVILRIGTVAAVPEPATWAMMLLGFGLVGGVLRSARNRKTKVTFATA